MLEKFSSGKTNGTKNAPLFYLRAPTHHSFIFKSEFLYELKVRLSKTVGGIFHYRFRFVFTKVYFIVQQNPWII